MKVMRRENVGGNVMRGVVSAVKVLGHVVERYVYVCNL
jgi:hypothetical protein